MSYIEWFNEHANKHKKIVDKLLARGLSEDEIIEYFDFDNMVKEENDFCPLYKEPVKCHDMEKLNCYLCACPHFRFNDEGVGKYNEYTILSKCDINNGSKFANNGVIHQDCSKCTVPHHKAYVKKTFDLDWKKIMKNCHLK
ncbi:MAG: hypothetical protein OQK48_02530 [Sulfurimonas sp.]|uniref:hypothetical protein n=1 Tax=Sulfurimonas sp. TaxID=2022749 RepID=UPI00261A32B3|nr:hypothetical protein [Sulfurimonas sp.]MCW8894594.1 hypothetical protein [Sulfurimonas sp.]MCW8953799.1 hypothetical protein [Sulfurimonas sp.]MCW9068031.1 hypothetical protein [Sulfurimonas sp.]